LLLYLPAVILPAHQKILHCAVALWRARLRDAMLFGDALFSTAHKHYAVLRCLSTRRRRAGIAATARHLPFRDADVNSSNGVAANSLRTYSSCARTAPPTTRFILHVHVRWMTAAC
jgi:hypothetical protein